MALYECVFIARQDISSGQVDGLVESFSEIITTGGGSVAKTEYWGLRNLSYRIKKNRKGHYVMLHLDAPHPAVAEMERNMRLNEDVLRQLTLKVDELEEGPSIVMQNKNERGGRRGDRDRGDRGDRGGRDRDRGDRGDRGDRDRPRRAAGEDADSGASASTASASTASESTASETTTSNEAES